MRLFVIPILKTIHPKKGKNAFSHGLILGCMRDMMAVLILMGIKEGLGAQQKYRNRECILIIAMSMVFATKNAWKQVILIIKIKYVYKK